MVRDFNNFLSITGGRNRQKIIKDIVSLNNIIYQLNLTDIHRTFHTTVAEYTFFSSAQRTFTSKDYILGFKTNLNKFKRIQFIKSLFSDHDGIDLEINRKILGKVLNSWKLNNMFLNNSSVKEEIKGALWMFWTS